MRTTLTLVLSLSVLVFTACKNKDTGGGTSAESAKPAESPVKRSFKKLGSLPVEAEIPEDANVEDSTKAAGFPSVTVYASPTTFIFGGGDMSEVKPTIDDTKKRLAKEVNGFKAWTREDKTADGWILEGTGESMIDKNPLYAVSVRRTISGAPYDCGTNAQSREEMAAAERLCASLRPAK
jgi:hypothetical protein